MKTIRLFFATFFVLILVIISSCERKSGHKNGETPKALTEKEALDTCFQEIASFQILVNKENKFSLERVSQTNAFYGVADLYLDSLSKTEKTVYDYKVVHICLLKNNLPAWKICLFIKNHGNFLTVQDMMALYEQNRFEIPPYTWIMGGDFINDIPAMYFIDNYKKTKEYPRGTFIGFDAEDKEFEYLANCFAVAYWESITK